MKKTLSIISAIALGAGVLAGCGAKTDVPAETAISSVLSSEKATEKATEKAAEKSGNVVKPLPETLDVNNLENCTVAVSLEKGGAYVDDSGKMVMNVTVYSYDLYDMADIASLEKGDVIVRKNKEVTITDIERPESGFVSINGGEENGGFDLVSSDDTVYYEIGMNDIKAYHELGKATLPVSDEFEYIDESDIDAGEKKYFAGDFLTDAGIEYDFNQNNTSIVIENGTVVKMNKIYMP